MTSFGHSSLLLVSASCILLYCIKEYRSKMEHIVLNWSMLDEDYDFDAYGNIQILALSNSVDDDDKS